MTQPVAITVEGREVTFRVPVDVYAELERIARKRNVGIDQVFASAVGLELTAEEIRDKGGRLLAETRGTFQEVAV